MDSNLIDIFKKAFPMLVDKARLFCPHGKDHLIIWFDSGQALIFTLYNSRCIIEPYLNEVTNEL